MDNLTYSFPEEKIRGIMAEGPRLRLRRAEESGAGEPEVHRAF